MSFLKNPRPSRRDVLKAVSALGVASTLPLALAKPAKSGAHTPSGDPLRWVNQRIGTELDGESLGIKQSDKESGPLTLNLGLLNIGADFASAGIDIRYPVTSNGDAIFAAISNCAVASGLEVTLYADTKPLFLPESSPFISLLQDSFATVTGKQANVYATGGGTYARAFHGNAVAFGLLFADEPDRRLHNTNEHIDIEYFMLHAQVCLEAMYHMLTDE